MEPPEGKLCQTCTTTLHGDTFIHDWEERILVRGSPHHTNYAGLVSSKNSGCFICIWLWEKHVPPEPGPGSEIQGFACGSFQVFCEISPQGGTIRIYYYIKCPWAADLELNVSVLKPPEARRQGAVTRHSPQRDFEDHPWLKLDRHLGSSHDLETIRAWISACEAKHQYCDPTRSGVDAFLPTRILDVQEAGVQDGIVRLRDQDDPQLQSQSPLPVYWTLSHRWGDPGAIVQLLKTTEHRLRDGLSLQELPPTFRDAVLLVHRLGYRYIWIDSLCVFQDSPADWQKEANTMVDVYRYSFCNISAAGASYDPSNTGLFCPRENPRSLYPFTANVDIVKFVTSDQKTVFHGPWTFRNELVWFNEVESAPISSRGWVVQERFLAARVLHFTRNEIYWECLENRCPSIDPTCSVSFKFDQLSWQAERYKKPRLELARTRARVVAAGLPYLDPNSRDQYQAHVYHREWGRIVGVYTGCALTKESDRFLAMSGIAKLFREINGDEYLAGLWKRMIYTDLLWRTNANRGVQTRRVTDAYAPSWSWASVVGGEIRLGMPQTKFGSLSTPLIRLTNAHVVPEPLGGDPMGLLRCAELDIECMRYYYRWSGRQRVLTVFKDEGRTECYFEQRDDGEPFLSNLQLDTSAILEMFEQAEEIEGVCVPIDAAYAGYGGGYNHYLILEHDSGDRFRRIGLLLGGRIGKWIDSQPAGCSLSHITLI